MLWLRRQNLTKASWTTSSASAADCTHCRAKSSNPGATSEKQLFQSSWLATLSMTFSRSLHSRRCQVQVLSTRAIFPDRGRNLARGKFAFNFARTQSYATFPKPNEESKAVAARVHICDFNPGCNASAPRFARARDECRTRAAVGGKTLSRLLLGRRWNQQPRSN